MHGIRFHENEHAPCNFYCTDETHSDVIYIAQRHLDKVQGNLLVHMRSLWVLQGFHRHSTLLNVQYAPEAIESTSYYPHTAKRVGVLNNPVALRVQYRVHHTGTLGA